MALMYDMFSQGRQIDADKCSKRPHSLGEEALIGPLKPVVGTFWKQVRPFGSHLLLILAFVVFMKLASTIQGLNQKRQRLWCLAVKLHFGHRAGILKLCRQHSASQSYFDDVLTHFKSILVSTQRPCKPSRGRLKTVAGFVATMFELW